MMYSGVMADLDGFIIPPGNQKERERERKECKKIFQAKGPHRPVDGGRGPGRAGLTLDTGKLDRCSLIIEYAERSRRRRGKG